MMPRDAQLPSASSLPPSSSLHRGQMQCTTSPLPDTIPPIFPTRFWDQPLPHPKGQHHQVNKPLNAKRALPKERTKNTLSADNAAEPESFSEWK